MEEVWEKEDGLDPDSFDPRTFFNLHGRDINNLKTTLSIYIELN